MRFCLCIIALLLLTACNSLQKRIDTATSLAHKNNFFKKTITSNQFTITSFYKHSPTTKSATIYIEGDGLSWIHSSGRKLHPGHSEAFVVPEWVVSWVGPRDRRLCQLSETTWPTAAGQLGHGEPSVAGVVRCGMVASSRGLMVEATSKLPPSANTEASALTSVA